ncbi:hypothetical protein [Kushneria aurantia]|uniref:Uncharacterized protein n=1 Tax=Kushneria aurantia TaxID=504092 RepID=A0ABV6G382_9GAMM|nr:hypothetical protein [Kushneria aurantia]
MVSVDELPALPSGEKQGYRLLPSKFPPIALFEDVASGDEFEILHELQALTNPCLQTKIGNLTLIDTNEIPFGIQGCFYATAPFTHVNPVCSRFSRGQLGMLKLFRFVGCTVFTKPYYWGHNKTNKENPP